MRLDILGARAARPYTRCEYAGRIAWALATPLFRFSPRPIYAWRRFMLRVFRASVGRDVRIDPSARIEIPWNLTIGDDASIGAGALVYNLGQVSIGARATVSHLAHLCAGTHDYELSSLPLLRLGIDIGPDAWICAEAFVGPAICVGAGAVVAARAVAVRDVPPWTVVAGNPASIVKLRKLRDGGAT